MVVSAATLGVRLYVLRHGEPERRDLFYGHHDIGLSPRGWAQARAQAERLGEVPFVALYSSDLGRARQGAERLAERVGGSVTIDPALREMHLGALEALAHADAQQRYPEWAGRSYLDMLDARMPGGGESVRELAERVYACVDRHVVEHAAAATAGRWPPVLIYGHNTVSRVLLARAAGAGVAGYTRFEQRYGAINRIDVPVCAEGAEAAVLRPDWAHASIGYANRDPLASVQG